MNKKFIRVAVIADRYARLRAKLILLGITFTAWLDKKIEEEIDD